MPLRDPPDTAVDSPYWVDKDDFKLKYCATEPPESAPDKAECRRRLAELQQDLAELQRQLYAQDQYSVLVIFQAMDAAGKDSTIARVFSGVDPAGCQVTSFKQPSAQELDHDFLWRCYGHLPERGKIGIFNRSYYEEVLAVRVHPEYLDQQKLPFRPESLDDLWQQRFESIRALEKHLARNGTVIIKFWLNISPEEQRQRFLERLEQPEKHYKFSASDLAERQYWADYQKAYGELLPATSRKHAPWYAIPADNKPYARYLVAKIMVETLSELGLSYPELSSAQQAHFAELRQQLSEE